MAPTDNRTSANADPSASAIGDARALREPRPRRDPAQVTESILAAPPAQPVEDPTPAEESTYTRAALLAGAMGFGVRRESVAAALRLLDEAADEREEPRPESFTRAQLEEAIEALNHREVK